MNFPTEVEDSTWYPNTGAANQMTADGSYVTNRWDYNDSEQITVLNGNTLPIHSVGDLHLFTSSSTFLLKDILHVPNIKANLLSVSRFVNDNDCIFLFDRNGFSIKDRKGNLLCHRPLKGLLFPVQAHINRDSFSTFLWHGTEDIHCSNLA